MDSMQPVQPMIQASQGLNRQEIQFPNGHTALAVTVPPTASADQVIKALGIRKPKALILVIGGAE